MIERNGGPRVVTTDTTERGLERLICTALAGHPCDPPSKSGERREPEAQSGGAGWSAGDLRDYDRSYCVDLAQLSAFLHATQPEAAAALALDEDGPARRKFLARLQGEITKRGTVDVLRNGLRHGPHELELLYGTPSPGNELARQRFGRNRFTVTRQLRYSNDRARLALDIAVPAAVSSRDVGDLESHLAALRSTAAESSRAADEHARTADGDARAARADLTGIGRSFDPDRDLDDLDAIVAAVDAKAEEARFAQRRARGAADDFAAIVEDVQQLRTLLQTAEDRALALGDLEDALKPGAFLKWLTLRRSHRLLVHASRMLGEMTAGKYAFVEPGEADEQWRVLDRESNQARSPASLSGGEQFIASLSLALGMVEMMARSGGRLESLFLDEGFGSLDRNNLDAAVQALGAVAARGRMVGVISHVRAVAEQIDHVLAVTRGAAGSRAEWLTDRQRRRLSESDTGLEAASALAGLLE